MSLLTSRASHHSAGIASHALLTIMFKDVPLLFWLIPFWRILINSLNYSGIYIRTIGLWMFPSKWKGWVFSWFATKNVGILCMAFEYAVALCTQVAPLIRVAGQFIFPLTSRKQDWKSIGIFCLWLDFTAVQFLNEISCLIAH